MNMESLQTLAFVVITVFFSLATVSILLRIYSRGVVLKSFEWDDWCMTSVLFFNAGHQAILYFFIRNGAGLHLTRVVTEHPEHLQNLVFGLFAEEIMYSFMHFIVKMAFLLFYLRFATKTFRKLVYATMGINFIFTLVTMLIYSLQCLPLDAFFHPAMHPDVKCLNKNTQAFVPAAFSITLDVIIVLLPIRSLWAIQVSIRKRIALISILSLGFIVVIISCIRLAVLLEFDPDPKLSDFTWVLGKLVIISSVELEVAIIVANAPSLKTLGEKWLKGRVYGDGSKSFGSRSGKGRNELGYAVDCVPMSDIKSQHFRATKKEKDAEKDTEKDGQGTLGRTDSEEQLWKHDSGIIVERSVGVTVTEQEQEPEADEKGGKEKRSGSRLGYRRGMNTTPPIEEEGGDDGEGERGRRSEGRFKDNFEAV